MKFSLEQTSGNRIAGYDAGEIRVQHLTAADESGRRHAQMLTFTRSVIITPRGIIEDWPPQQITDLTQSHLQPIIDSEPEVVLLGTGTRLAFAASAAMQPLYEAGLGVETMDTGAACRTFNILIAEGRRVTAALFVP